MPRISVSWKTKEFSQNWQLLEIASRKKPIFISRLLCTRNTHFILVLCGLSLVFFFFPINCSMFGEVHSKVIELWRIQANALVKIGRFHHYWTSAENPLLHSNHFCGIIKPLKTTLGKLIVELCPWTKTVTLSRQCQENMFPYSPPSLNSLNM